MLYPILLLLLFAGPVPAASVSWEQVLTLVRERNPRLAAARFAVESARAASSQAGRRPNPGLEVETENLGKKEAAAVLSQPLELGGKRKARKAAAEAAVRIAEINYEKISREAEAEAARRFTGALAAQLELALLDSAEAVSRAAIGAIQTLVQAGAAKNTDAIRANLELNGLELERNQMSREGQARRMELAALWAPASGDAAPEPAGTLDTLPPPPSFEKMREYCERHGPDHRLALAETEQANRLAQQAATGAYPDLEARAGYKNETGAHALFLGFSLDVPVFDRNRDAAQAARQHAQAAERHQAQGSADLSARLFRHYSELESARDEARILLREIIPKSMQMFEELQRMYRTGKSSHLELFLAHQEMIGYKRQHLQVLIKAWQARAEIETLAGTGLDQIQDQKP
jgi:cobalt-zinc-cadmium efflux system outer membrane protein